MPLRLHLPLPPGGWIRLDAIGGVAGDMFVAAAVATWPELAGRIAAAMETLCIPVAYVLDWPVVNRGGIAACQFVSAFAGEAAHPTGSVSEIKAFIQASDLSPEVRRIAIGLFDLIAAAEGEVHGRPADEVHLHEIADWDSIVDLVAAAVIIDAVGPVSWICPSLPLGGGTVRCAHGLLPVPAPATAILCRGARLRDDGIEGERVTPTGAAILAYLGAFDARNLHSGRLIGSGYGAGSKELPGVPNVLRLLVFADEGLSDGLADCERVANCHERAGHVPDHERLSRDFPSKRHEGAATPLRMIDADGVFHANCHEAAGHTPDHERQPRDFHANCHEGSGHTPEYERLCGDFHANALAEAGFVADRVAVLSFDIDDQSPEDLAIGLDRLRTVPGVLSVSSDMTAGKKGRLAFRIEILAKPSRLEAVVRACFNETTTLGLRWRVEDRWTLARQAVQVATADHGSAPVKIAQRLGGVVTAKLEADFVAGLDLSLRERELLSNRLKEQALAELVQQHEIQREGHGTERSGLKGADGYDAACGRPDHQDGQPT